MGSFFYCSPAVGFATYQWVRCQDTSFIYDRLVPFLQVTNCDLQRLDRPYRWVISRAPYRPCGDHFAESWSLHLLFVRDTDPTKTPGGGDEKKAADTSASTATAVGTSGVGVGVVAGSMDDVVKKPVSADMKRDDTRVVIAERTGATEWNELVAAEAARLQRGGPYEQAIPEGELRTARKNSRHSSYTSDLTVLPYQYDKWLEEEEKSVPYKDRTSGVIAEARLKQSRLRVVSAVMPDYNAMREFGVDPTEVLATLHVCK